MIEFESVNINTTPPGKWRYTQPETGKEFSHYSYGAFMDSIREHRLGNNIPMSVLWQEEIVDEFCRNCPDCFPDYCQRKAAGFQVRRFSFGATVSFLRMLYGWFKAGRPLVEQEEAERRAAICSTCPYNISLANGCGACFTTVMNLVVDVVGDRKTSKDSKLGQCGICSCALKAAVHFPLDAQLANLTEQIREDFRQVPWCWKKV